ncbi:MAG TPA: 1-(5-phosphoribosyl)-5-[(5-phosphoribosylamino)methylideneamino]imidazole-4-carboxamide isomerase [Woeseiaceae bacterium]|nr:1-(5-phosphoribosyl)-5-[(5-phosphoribosylamino)methylideneamino]imidazole-4-carboxamide isomerase [Woeseiaceae bacterium]
MRVIPAIDLKGGRCVRLYQGDFERETCYSKDPLEVARRFSEMGFDHLHVVDLDGALSGEQRHRDVVSKIADQTQFRLQVGGGIRSREGVADWLDAGAARCVIGSLAVTQPRTVAEWFREFGAERLVLALDVRTADDTPPVVATHGWTATSSLTLWDCVDAYAGCSLQHVLCTDIGRDGAMTGPNTSLYSQFMRRYPEVELQASGGVRHGADLEALSKLGCAAAITGRALLDGRISTEDVLPFLRNA